MEKHSLLAYKDIFENEGLLKDFFFKDDNTLVYDITYNSKAVKDGTLFVCKGAAFKEDYLKEAIQSGCVCYLSEKKYDDINSSYILVSDVRKAMAILADFFFDHAYSKFNLIGITGTKGKSTTAYYLKYIIDEYMQSKLSLPCGIVSSIDTFDGKTLKESHLTTPEAIELHRHFANAAQMDLEHFVMEVSSQALKYDRVLNVLFDIAIFLNISEDHISPVEHSDFDDYLDAKLKIFSQCKTALVNTDTDCFDRVYKSAQNCKDLILFGKDEKADFYIHDIKKLNSNTSFFIKTRDFDEEFVLTMPGLFNVENAAAAIAAAVKLDIPLDVIKSGLLKAKSSGRMEVYSSEDNNVIAIVDYAHNKLSFEKLYESVKEEFKGREIVTVFGCPGGKAYNRRKELGFLSSENSDRVYLTMEDPNLEDVKDICLDIKSYMKNDNCKCFIIPDRKEAIEKAITDSKNPSVILITGKGNETRQKIQNKYVPCDTDTQCVKDCFEKIAIKN